MVTQKERSAFSDQLSAFATVADGKAES